MKWCLLVWNIMLTTPAWAGFNEAVASFQQGSYEFALRKFKLLAQQGNITAQYNLAYMYAKGLGVNQSYQQAFKWFSLAAQQGDAESQFHLAGMYEHGLGVNQNYIRAVIWYQKAAERGVAAAQVSLGGLYGIGLGVTKSDMQAYTWFSLAAQQGDFYASQAEVLLASSMSPQETQQADMNAQKIAKKYTTLR
jgi:TPR repeat protein